MRYPAGKNAQSSQQDVACLQTATQKLHVIRLYCLSFKSSCLPSQPALSVQTQGPLASPTGNG